MIHHEVEQGSVEWHGLRLGKPTASAFHRIVTPTGRISKAREAYSCELIAERLLKRPVVEFDNAWTIRGTDLEARACDYYQLAYETDLELCGFFTTDDEKVGASPDFLAGKDGLVEIKCPKTTHHVAYMLGLGDVVKEHRIQVQGQMWVTERKWCDVLSYNDDGLPQAIHRVERDEEFISSLSTHVGAFCTMLDEFWERLQ